MNNQSLSNRMKRYEQSAKHALIPNMPVVVRVDGKSFRSFTKQFNNRPFDDGMNDAMVSALRRLMFESQNCIVGYTHSDEMSVIMYDNQIGTDTWFGNDLQKIASVSAAAVTAAFNDYLATNVAKEVRFRLGLFDARAFNIPEHEIINYLIWRQSDCKTNSVNVLGRHYFSHKQLHGLSARDVQQKLFDEAGVDWEQIDNWKRLGTALLTHNGADNYPHFVEQRDFVDLDRLFD